MALDFTKYEKHTVTDCHVHLWMLRKNITQELIQQQAMALTEAISHSELDAMYIFSRNDSSALRIKKQAPELFYAGGYAPWSGDTPSFKLQNWSKYIESLIELGYDGVGEMGSKTVDRSKHTPLDS